MDNSIWKWVYLVGAAVAGLAGMFSFANDYLTWVLMIVAVLVGLFFMDSDDVVNFGIRFLLLAATAASLGSFIAVGPYIAGFFTGVVAFLAPVGLTMLVVFGWKKYFGSM
jgi:hypothetical protein